MVHFSIDYEGLRYFVSVSLVSFPFNFFFFGGDFFSLAL